jgi:hypothetical protein
MFEQRLIYLLKQVQKEGCKPHGLQRTPLITHASSLSVHLEPVLTGYALCSPGGRCVLKTKFHRCRCEIRYRHQHAIAPSYVKKFITFFFEGKGPCFGPDGRNRALNLVGHVFGDRDRHPYKIVGDIAAVQAHLAGSEGPFALQLFS